MRKCARCAPTRRTVLAALTTAAAATVAAGCSRGSAASPPSSAPPTTVPTPTQVAARATVPVLCYHQFREWTPKDKKYDRDNLVIPPANFVAHLDALKADGWNAISPEVYYRHLREDTPLPAKPFMITMDDGTEGQVRVAIPEILKRAMTATLFPMTVVLNKKGWCSEADLKAVADQGVTIGVHTANHARVDKLTTEQEWSYQLAEPRAQLQKITGQPVNYLAYPYGTWNAQALPGVERLGFKAAFQLTEHPLDPDRPELTLRRQLAVSTWTGPQLVAKLTALAGKP